MKSLHYLQQEAIDQGTLEIRVRGKSTGAPIKEAKIKISYTGNPDTILEEVNSDASDAFSKNKSTLVSSFSNIFLSVTFCLSAL